MITNMRFKGQRCRLRKPQCILSPTSGIQPPRRSLLTSSSPWTSASGLVKAEPFPEARKSAYKLSIDFGPTLGTKRSSAQITTHYTPEELVGRQVAAVVNFPPRQIGKFMSEVLTVGFPDQNGAVVLFSPDRPVPNGARLF